MTDTLTATACTECDAAVPLPDGELITGEIVRCPDCAAELEVWSTAPLRLVLAPPAEEDWGE